MKQPYEMKLLGNAPCAVTMHKDGKLILTVYIMVGRDNPDVQYSELKVRAFDAAGVEIPVSPLLPQEKTLGRVRHQCHGHYVLAVKNGQLAVQIEVTRGRDKALFPVPELLKGVRRP